MDEKTLKVYNGLLSDKLVKMFNISREAAEHAVKNSVIQRLIKEEPEFVDTTPLEYWVNEIYKEIIRRKVG